MRSGRNLPRPIGVSRRTLRLSRRTYHSARPMHSSTERFNIGYISQTCPQLLLITVRPGMSCDAGDICIGASTCINGICTCPENKVIRRDKCVSRSLGDLSIFLKSDISYWRMICLVRVGFLCHADDICGGNSTCINGICTCAKGRVARNERCIIAPEGRFESFLF